MHGTLQVPQNFDLVAQRKGFKRYVSPRMRELISELEEAKEQKEKALTGILQVSECGVGLRRRDVLESMGWLKVRCPSLGMQMLELNP